MCASAKLQTVPGHRSLGSNTIVQMASIETLNAKGIWWLHLC